MLCDHEYGKKERKKAKDEVELAMDRVFQRRSEMCLSRFGLSQLEVQDRQDCDCSVTLRLFGDILNSNRD